MALVNKSPPASQGLPRWRPLGKTPMELTKTPFWFEVNNPALVWEPQSIPPTDPKKERLVPRSCLDLPTWPLQVCRYFPQDL